MDRALRWLIAALLGAAAALMVTEAASIRAFEAQSVAFWLGPILPGGVRAVGTYFMVHLGDGDLVAFNVTMECTIVLLIAPVTVVGALLIAFTRVEVLQALGATGAAVTVDAVLNQLRLGLIAWTTQKWGLSIGFDIGHRYIGSLIALSAFTLGLVTLLWVVLRSRRPPPPGPWRT